MGESYANDMCGITGLPPHPDPLPTFTGGEGVGLCVGEYIVWNLGSPIAVIRSMKRIHVLVVVLGLLVLAIILELCLPESVILHMKGMKTVEDRMKEYGPAAHERLSFCFAKAGVEYPPKRVVLLGLKNERQVQVYASDRDGRMHFVRSYRIQAASGSMGPKLREGDCQVPEGIYRVESLNPNSRYHLSLRLNYPNEFDRAMGEKDGRSDLGTDIMIHGGALSIGCIAVGDEAAEDLFVLAVDTGIEHVKVILSPVDFRTNKFPSDAPREPQWIDQVYDDIRSELRGLPG